jgi:hypothetical protein
MPNPFSTKSFVPNFGQPIPQQSCALAACFVLCPSISSSPNLSSPPLPPLLSASIPFLFRINCCCSHFPSSAQPFFAFFMSSTLDGMPKKSGSAQICRFMRISSPAGSWFQPSIFCLVLCSIVVAVVEPILLAASTGCGSSPRRQKIRYSIHPSPPRPPSIQSNCTHWPPLFLHKITLQANDRRRSKKGRLMAASGPGNQGRKGIWDGWKTRGPRTVVEGRNLAPGTGRTEKLLAV